MKSKVIVALDGMNRAEAIESARTLRDQVWGFKVNDLLIQCGVEIVKELKNFGNVFADPKLYDIPNTVGNSIKTLAAAGADLITIHASGGREMFAAAIRECGSAKILAVTVLTSMDDARSTEIYGGAAAETVRRLGSGAAKAGIHGVVCSPKELEIFAAFPELLKVTPGVRPEWYGKSDDQSRTLTPSEAIKGGATHLVIGRPITGHEDPVKAVKLIDQELQG